MSSFKPKMEVLDIEESKLCSTSSISSPKLISTLTTFDYPSPSPTATSPTLSSSTAITSIAGGTNSCLTENSFIYNINSNNHSQTVANSSSYVCSNNGNLNTEHNLITSTTNTTITPMLPVITRNDTNNHMINQHSNFNNGFTIDYLLHDSLIQGENVSENMSKYWYLDTESVTIPNRNSKDTSTSINNSCNVQHQIEGNDVNNGYINNTNIIDQSSNLNRYQIYQLNNAYSFNNITFPNTAMIPTSYSNCPNSNFNITDNVNINSISNHSNSQSNPDLNSYYRTATISTTTAASASVQAPVSAAPAIIGTATTTSSSQESHIANLNQQPNPFTHNLTSNPKALSSCIEIATATVASSVETVTTTTIDPVSNSKNLVKSELSDEGFKTNSFNKFSNLDSNKSVSELEIKLQLKRERNRLAARKCRNKKLNQIEEYQRQIETLTKDIEKYQIDIAKLNSRKAELRAAILNFFCLRQHHQQQKQQQV